METKCCNTCHEELPRERFSKMARNKDGLRHMCKGCTSKYQVQYRKAHPEYQERQNTWIKNYRQSERYWAKQLETAQKKCHELGVN